MDMMHALACGWDKVDSLAREAGVQNQGPATGEGLAQYVEVLEATVAGQEAARLMNADPTAVAA